MDRQYDLHDHSAINSPESKASSPNGGGDKPKQLRVVERGSQACNECRRHKVGGMLLGWFLGGPLDGS